MAFAGRSTRQGSRVRKASAAAAQRHDRSVRAARQHLRIATATCWSARCRPRASTRCRTIRQIPTRRSSSCSPSWARSDKATTDRCAIRICSSCGSPAKSARRSGQSSARSTFPAFDSSKRIPGGASTLPVRPRRRFSASSASTKTGSTGSSTRSTICSKARPGEVTIEADEFGRPIPFGHEKVVRAGEAGLSLELTLDSYLQFVTERALEKQVKTYHARAVRRSSWIRDTGEVLAMANFPHFDPTSTGNIRRIRYRDRAVQDAYEPGSTYQTRHCGGRARIAQGHACSRAFPRPIRWRSAGARIHNAEDGFIARSEQRDARRRSSRIRSTSAPRKSAARRRPRFLPNGTARRLRRTHANRFRGRKPRHRSAAGRVERKFARDDVVRQGVR